MAIGCQFAVSFGQQQTNKPFCDPKINVPNEEQLGIIYDHVKSFPENTQVSFAFLVDGKATFYGIIRNGDAIPRMDNYQMVFEIGSITKVFTSTILARLVTEGRIRLEDPIQPHLNFPIKDNITFTFQQLANHTSGLPRLPSNFSLGAMLSPDNPYKNYTISKLEKYLKDEVMLAHPSGEKWDYSNLGMGVLEYTLTQVTGQDFQTLLDTLIFAPLGMTHSTATFSRVTGNLVPGQGALGKPTANWEFAALGGAGCILSTAEDMSKFALAQFDSIRQELALTRTQTFQINERMGIGLGWFIIQSKTGAQWHWHNGATGGYRSSMALDIKQKNGLIVLSNVSSFHPDAGKIDELCHALLNTLPVGNE